MHPYSAQLKSAWSRFPSSYFLSDRLFCGMLLLVASAVGCGDDPQPENPTLAPPPAAEQKPLGFAPRAKPKEEPKGLDLSGVDPDELFAVADVPPSNFVTVGIAPPGEATDRFKGTSWGRDESSFRVQRTADGGSENEAARPLPEGFQAIASAPTIDGLPSRILCQADGSHMVLVPKGPSFVGWDAGPPHVGPQVNVNVGAFYISVTFRHFYCLAFPPTSPRTAAR